LQAKTSLKTMFKFYSIPDLNVLNSVLGKTPSIRFSSAYNLNDPFELKFNLIINPNEKGHKDEFFKTHPDGTLQEFSEWCQNVKTKEAFVWYIEQEQRNSLTKVITLSSFTEDNKSNLMWSHYANNHSGICIQYSSVLFFYLETVKKFLLASKVKYSKYPPKINMLEDIYSKTSKMLFNKQIEWKYEKEYRVALFSDYETDYIEIGSELIKAVYIGARASKEVVDNVIEITKHTNIEVYFGITMGNNYEVQFKKYKEGTIYMRSFW